MGAHVRDGTAILTFLAFAAVVAAAVLAASATTGETTSLVLVAVQLVIVMTGFWNAEAPSPRDDDPAERIDIYRVNVASEIAMTALLAFAVILAAIFVAEYNGWICTPETLGTIRNCVARDPDDVLLALGGAGFAGAILLTRLVRRRIASAGGTLVVLTLVAAALLYAYLLFWFELPAEPVDQTSAAFYLELGVLAGVSILMAAAAYFGAAPAYYISSDDEEVSPFIVWEIVVGFVILVAVLIAIWASAGIIDDLGAWISSVIDQLLSQEGPTKPNPRGHDQPGTGPSGMMLIAGICILIAIFGALLCAMIPTGGKRRAARRRRH